MTKPNKTAHAQPSATTTESQEDPTLLAPSALQHTGAGAWARMVLFLALTLLLVGGGFLLAREHLTRLLGDARSRNDQQLTRGFERLSRDYQAGLQAVILENERARQARQADLRRAQVELERARKQFAVRLDKHSHKILTLEKDKLLLLEQRAREGGRHQQALGLTQDRIKRLLAERDKLANKLAALEKTVERLEARLQRTLTPAEIRRLQNEDEEEPGQAPRKKKP